MRKQSGAALIVVLAVLVVTLMLGLSSMQSSLIDERSAGNYRAQVQAQMAAEHGIANAIAQESIPLGETVVFDEASVTFFDVEKSQEDAFETVQDIGGWDDLVALVGLEPSPGKMLLSASEDWPPGEQGMQAAYAFVKDDGERYLVAVGRLFKNGSEVSRSQPVFLRFAPAFDFNNALTVLGGIQEVNGQPSWYPNSANAGVNGGDSGSAVFYEGAPHACETNADPQGCYEGLHLYGGVEYGGEQNDDAREDFRQLYEAISGKAGIITSSATDADPAIQWVDRNASCADEGVYQVAILQEFESKNNSKFCGLLVVWGGYVNIDDYDPDVTLSGNENIEGTLIVGNYAVGDGGGPDFAKPIDEVDLTINGGGVNGSIYFNRGIVVDSLLALGAADLVDNFFPVGGDDRFVFSSWN